MVSIRQAVKRGGAEPETSATKTLCFVDREAETHRLRQAILHCKSLMICGAAGVGKSALISNVIDELPESVTARCIRLPGMRDLRDLLQRLVRALYKAGGHSLRSELRAQGVSAATFDAWLTTAPSSRLRGTLYRAVESGDYRIFLDHLPSMTRSIARVIKELFWMRKTPVYVVPCGLSEDGVGRLMRYFYWGDAERLALDSLPMPAAHQLMEWCIARFGLSELDLEDFRGEALRLSGRVPGVIVGMCSLAADTRYRYGSGIKTRTVYLDYLMKGQGVGVSEAGRRPC
jgi:hypothetical protein